MASRYSVYSNVSSAPRPAAQSSQVSTTSLLNALHSFYASGQPYQLDASTSLVVNTWVTAHSHLPDGSSAVTIDRDLAARAWEHARRRAEDGCIVLWYGNTDVLQRHIALAVSTNILPVLHIIQRLRCWRPFSRRCR